MSGQFPIGNQIAKRRGDRREDYARRLAFIMDARRRGLSYAIIGAQCDPPISGVRVYHLYKKGLAEIPAASIAELRTENNERLENLIARFEAVAETFHPLMHNGQVVLNPNDGLPVRDLKLNMEALKLILATSESLRRLNGVDAPARTQIEATHVVRHEVVGVDMDRL